MENKSKMLVLGIMWVAILGMGAMGYKWLYRPHKEKVEIAAKEEARTQTIQATSSAQLFRTTVRFAEDSFSGYAVVRSPEFRTHLRTRAVKLEINDDRADYPARLAAIKDGTIDAATFTVDALIKTSAEMGEMPATIVLVIDETKGADGLLAYKAKYPNIDSMNNPKTKFILVKDSPSEMLVRLMRASFNLDKLSSDCMIYVEDGEKVYNKFRSSGPKDDLVFVTWEPYIQKMLDNENVGVLIDSSNFRGYIMDVLVFNRDFLQKNHAAAKDLVEAYLRSSYDLQHMLPKLILNDASSLNTPLSVKQAHALVSGVWWKNTQENYGHMSVDRGTGLLSMDDIITNITGILLRSGAIKSDPTNGQPNLLYYNTLLQELKDAQFHPGNSESSNGAVRNELLLNPLNEEEWKHLKSVGTLQVEDITFRRGTAELRDTGIGVLDKLVLSLNTWSSYYVSVRGDASTIGDQETNVALASKRAIVVADYLKSKGIDGNRVRAVSGVPAGTSRVSFVLGQVPY